MIDSFWLRDNNFSVAQIKFIMDMIKADFPIASFDLWLKISDRSWSPMSLNDMILFIDSCIIIRKSFIWSSPQTDDLFSDGYFLVLYLCCIFMYCILSSINSWIIYRFLFLNLLNSSISTFSIKLWISFIGLGATLLAWSERTLLCAIISLFF